MDEKQLNKLAREAALHHYSESWRYGERWIEAWFDGNLVEQAVMGTPRERELAIDAACRRHARAFDEYADDIKEIERADAVSWLEAIRKAMMDRVEDFAIVIGYAPECDITNAFKPKITKQETP